MSIVEAIEQADQTDQAAALRTYKKLVRKPNHSDADTIELRSAMRVLNLSPDDLRSDLEARRQFADEARRMKSAAELKVLQQRSQSAAAQAEKEMQKLAADLFAKIPMSILQHLLRDTYQLTIQHLGFRCNDYLSQLDFTDRYTAIMSLERDAKSAYSNAEAGSNYAYEERFQLKKKNSRAFSDEDDPAALPVAADGAEGE